MNSTLLFNDKKHDSVSRIKTCLALPPTTNPTISNAKDLNSVSSNPQNNNHIVAKLPKIENPSLTINRLSGKVLGISFPQPLIVKQIYPTLLNFLILKAF